jgi:hypothetical protein
LFSSPASGVVILSDLLRVTSSYTSIPSTGLPRAGGRGTSQLNTTLGGRDFLQISFDYFGNVESGLSGSPLFDTPIYANPGRIASASIVFTNGRYISTNGGFSDALSQVTILRNSNNTVDFPILMYISSLGSTSIPQTFTFNQPFTVVSGDTNLSNPSGNILTGTEGNGVIRFNGKPTSITWTTSAIEKSTGFQFGVDTAPIPETSSACLALLSSLLLLRRNRRQN